jgi:hypothetical protein
MRPTRKNRITKYYTINYDQLSVKEHDGKLGLKFDGSLNRWLIYKLGDEAKVMGIFRSHREAEEYLVTGTKK